MKRLLKRLIGADREKIIAVIGLTRDDVEAGVAHARTAGETHPIRTWCAEDTTAWTMRRELRACWPALILVSWTGRRGDGAFKSLPLTVPPFRVVIFNEARGFFPARPGPLAKHVHHRTWVAVCNGANLTKDLARGAGMWIWSLFYRAGQRVRDVVMLVWSMIYRSGEFVVRMFWFCIALVGLAFEGFLALLAFVAQVTPAMARSKYAGLRREEVRPEEIGPPRGESFVEVEIHGRRWRRGPVRKAQASFVVFRKPGEKASAEPLIRLAIEQNAFAVARQIAWSGWRERVTTKHPFRRLLPGEVSRVLMPFSSLIVVRRDLMSVPRATTFGAALMLMFHKAGPGLVVGHDGPITQEPAMPLEDFEFAMRSSTRVEQDLARGNVVSSPSHAKPFRGLPRVLIVSPYLPFPLSHGGAVRIYNVCRSLRDKVDFVLVCFREVNETVRYPELHEVFREVYTVDIDEKSSDPGVPKQVADYRNTAMSALIRELARRVDIVQLEYTQMAEYRACAEGRPVILVEHDITFTLYRQLGRDYEVWERFESEALRSVDAVWTMSERDRDLAIEHGASKESTFAVPNGVDLRRFQPQPRETPGQSVLLVGSFRHLPNLLAFEALRQTIMPAVWREFPECRLVAIAGPDHEKWARQAGKGKLLAADPRVAIHGFVEDVRPAYRECDVVAIPLPVSAGTNIKLMEAMACGRAIVSTSGRLRGFGPEGRS